MTRLYKTCVVAFVDLLGFKQALKDESNANAILDILNQIKRGETTSCLASTQTISASTEIRIKPTISAFSDNIVISVPETVLTEIISWRHAVIEILNIIQQLANLVIRKGFLLRGGITTGLLYHQNGIVFGPALSEAYKLESEHANYPRILASPQLVDLCNADKNGGTHNCFAQDDDGDYYLDYLPTALSYSSHGGGYSDVIQHNIMNLMKVAINNPRHLSILEKWFWFEKYYNLCLEKIFE